MLKTNIILIHSLRKRRGWGYRSTFCHAHEMSAFPGKWYWRYWTELQVVISSSEEKFVRTLMFLCAGWPNISAQVLRWPHWKCNNFVHTTHGGIEYPSHHQSIMQFHFLIFFWRNILIIFVWISCSSRMVSVTGQWPPSNKHVIDTGYIAERTVCDLRRAS